jgi:hypothetical protein
LAFFIMADMKWPPRRMTWRRVGLVIVIGACLQAVLLAASFLVPAGARIHALFWTSLVMYLALLWWGSEPR